MAGFLLHTILVLLCQMRIQLLLLYVWIIISKPSARWYTGSGIYANTYINVRELIHVPTSGVFVKTKGDSIFVSTKIANLSYKKEKLKLISSIVDVKGNLIDVKESKLKIEPKNSKIMVLKTQVKKPILWSVDNPNLYTLISEVYDGDKLLDKIETNFGIRDIEWKASTGMWLNGENVKLKGVCNHQDAGALGVAVPDKIVRYRIQQLKNMGCNAIRTAHNAQTPDFYKACDEMGMLVMEEFFDGWKKKASHDYGAHSFTEW